jgi:hypothetical protein
MDIWGHLITGMRQRYKAPTEAVCNEDDHGEQNVDRNYLLCMKCLDSNSKLRHRTTTVAINIHPLLKPKLE